MLFTKEDRPSITGLTSMVTLRGITGLNILRMAYLSRTTQTGITRTGIRRRSSLIDTPTRGLTRLTVTTNRGTVRGTAAAGCGSEFDRDS